MADLRIEDDPFPELTALAARIDTAAGVYAAKRKRGHDSKFRSGVLHDQTRRLLEYCRDHCRVTGDAVIAIAARGVPLLCDLVNPDTEHAEHDETLGYGVAIRTEYIPDLPDRAKDDALDVLRRVYNAAHSDDPSQPEGREVRDEYLLLWHLDEGHYVDVMLALVTLLLALHEGTAELSSVPAENVTTVEESNGNAS